MVSKWCPKDIKADISMPTNAKARVEGREDNGAGCRFTKEK